jgi:hypothetical protein
MPNPISALSGLGSTLFSGGADIVGNTMATNRLRSANTKARNELVGGYNQAQGYQQPIYNTALQNYSNLSNQYAAGNFNNPKMTPYQFDPNSVFQDPEYQAQMRAGTEALNSGAQAKGRLFSGANQKDLMRYGQDVFSGRSNELYNRGFNAQNTAFNQNLLGSGQNFNQGYQLTNPLAGAASSLTNLAGERGSDLANLALSRGNINANKINQMAGTIGNMGQKIGGAGADYFSGGGGGGSANGLGSLLGPDTMQLLASLGI